MVGLHYCARVGYSAVFKQLTLMYAPQLKQLELPNPNITKNSFLTNVLYTKHVPSDRTHERQR